MEIRRLVKQIRKHFRILVDGVGPSAIQGRFIGPKVLINSIPKAGTNLLQELILLLPLMRGCVRRTLTLRKGSEWLVNELSSLKKGQCAGAHVSYDAAVDKAIRENGISHVLIVRDFRDVIYSYIHYLHALHKSHPHNTVFGGLSTLDEKIQACLSSRPEIGMMAWPEMISRYRQWLSAGDILVVRYENLINQDSKIAEAEIHRIIDYLNLMPEIDVSEVRNKMFNSKGLTFNAPGIGKWKKNFNQHQIAVLNQALGEELMFFGYEI